MNTVFILMAQYGARAIIPIEDVCRDYFAPLTLPKLLQKIAIGDIALPLVRMSGSLKAAKGVHIMDPAAYIDKQRAATVRKHETFHRNGNRSGKWAGASVTRVSVAQSAMLGAGSQAPCLETAGSSQGSASSLSASGSVCFCRPRPCGRSRTASSRARRGRFETRQGSCALRARE